MQWLKIVGAGSYVFGWFSRAGADKVITLEELIELVGGLLNILDLPVRIQLPTDLAHVTEALQHLPNVEMKW